MDKDSQTFLFRMTISALGFVCVLLLSAISWWLSELHADIEEMRPKVERAAIWIELTAREEVENGD